MLCIISDKMIIKYCLTLLFIMLFYSFGFSQTKVVGTVIDENNNPIENVNVIIKDSENIIVGSALTDSIGYFSLSTVLKNIKLEIAQLGEIYFTKEMELIEDANLGNIKIDNSRILQEIVITSKKTALQKELGKFVVDNISTSSFAKGKSSYEILDYVPILNSTEKGISIFNKSEATIFINGKLIRDSETALNMLKSIPATSIKKVEIITNPDSKFEANSKNGIINIILKNNDNEGLKGSVSASMNHAYFNSQYGSGFLSYSKKKIALTSGINIDNTKSFSRFSYVYDNLALNKQTEIQSYTINRGTNYSFFINSEYKLNDKIIVGLQLTYKLRDIKSNTETNNIFKNIGSDLVNSTSLNIINNLIPNNNSFTSNINITYQLDDLGSSIYIDNNQVVRNNSFVNQFDYINSNTSNEKFIQSQDERFNINATKINITKVVNDNSTLYFGGNFIYSDIKNDFFHGNFDGTDYLSDPLQSNIFTYTDKTIAGYIIYEILNEKWEGKIGLRLENFEGKGTTASNANKTDIKNTYLFPSLSFLFMPNDDNEISLDLNSYIIRPYYSQLNPFIRYNSTNSYTISNPNLLPSLSYELTLGYAFQYTYFINLSYAYTENLFNEFDVVLPSNLIQKTTANYGSGNEFYLDFIYTNQFFSKNLNFTASFEYIYNDSKGYYNDFDMSYSNHFYSFRLKNQINLSKKKDLNFSCIYAYSSIDRSVLGQMNALHSLRLELTKTYKNFSASFSVYDILRADLEFSEAKELYGFYKKIDYFKNFRLNFRYNFGNKKVNTIDEKKSDIQR
ncbi:MAG: hypothetical protein EAZ55_09845 [Cytophagales bacterium]|nr:MAG: hypothetical protein EAZ55_09845 [Cytophagales bacterium]